MAHDPKSAYEEAAASWPLPRILAYYGLGHLAELTTAQLKREPCPFCGKKGKFALFRGNKSGRLCCRCWSESCPGYGMIDEIAFIQRREGLPDTQHGRNVAFKKYLDLAGVTIERRVQDSTQESSGLPVAEEKKSPASEPEPANRPENLISFAPNSSKKSGSGSGPSTADVWAVFHSRLTLTAADRARLKEKRGFTDETIDRLMFRSSIPGNIEIIESLRKDFPDYLLIESGLFKMQSGRMIPECQFAGRGVTGEKDEKGEPIWGNTNPIIIPYLDPQGRILSMRPHKGNIAKKDKDDDEICLGASYCPFLLETRLNDFESTSPLFGTIVLTESEFKAAALWQAGFPAIGIPGTSFVRNPIFRARLVDLLSKYHVKKIIIVFDNEVKDNPALPSYKPDPFDRYWTIVWARYIAWDLMNCNPRPSSLDAVLIGQLPDEWRLDDSGKDTGKIDWDTALANFVAREGPVHGTVRATREFERVLLEAHSPKDFIARVPAAAQAIIQTHLDRLWYTPLLKSGGVREERLARRFEKIDSRSTVQIQQWAQEMVKALRSVNGTYYVPELPTQKERPYLLKLKEDLDDKIAELKKHRDDKTPPGTESVEEKIDRLILERRLITETLERGVPDRKSNFTLECRYCLHTATGDTERIINITNNLGEETGFLRVPADSLGRLAEFRVWCLGKAKGVPIWRGGEKDLQALTEDMKHYSAWRNVHEVPYYGFHAESKIWFAGDCAWAPDGSLILPNAENIFWYNGVGYVTPNGSSARPHRVDDGFQQGAPSFIRPQKNEPGVRELFELLSEGLVNTVGDQGGLLCIGCMLLYAAAPEVCREYGGHPGLWLYGRKGSGKNTIARWLMKIWGFSDLQGIRLEGTTPVGLNRVLSQSSCFPEWLDEYRRIIADIEQKESVLRGAFDRSSAAKGRLDSSNRTQTARALTTPLVTGENSSSDAATRSRYVHVNLSPSRRRLDLTENGKLLEILRTKSDSFYLIGKYLMDHRAEFVSNVLSLIKSWMENQVGISDDRTRFVHGAGWAAYIAFAELLNANCCDPKAFAEYVIQHSRKAFEDTHDETMVNRFWLEVIGGINTGSISRGFFFEREVTLNKDGGYDPSAVPDQATTTRVIFMASQEIYQEYEKDMRHRGNTPPLSRNDIAREISNEPYWIKAEGSNRVHRISQNGKRYACWAIHVDKFPLGQLLSDALQTSSMT